MTTNTANRRLFSRNRRLMLLGAAGASMSPLPGCGGSSSRQDALDFNAPALTDSVPAAAEGRSLPLIPLEEGVVDAAGVRNFELRTQRGATQFRSGVRTDTFGFNGALLGPALRLRTGEKTTVQILNRLDEATTVHWHGLMLPAEADGGPHQIIASGGQWQASFTVSNPASTCWYHPHVHGATGRQVAMGLSGLLIVEDPSAAGTGLPSIWGVDDIALVLQDKRFTAAGQIDYTLTSSDRFYGYVGDTLLVNGAIGPIWQAPRQWVRLRLVNGCNARFLSLRLSGAVALYQVANEGGLLAEPVRREYVSLAPGERCEVLVDFGSLISGAEVLLLAATNGAAMGMSSGYGSAEIAAMTFRAELPRQAGGIGQLPATLASPSPVVARAGATVRYFTLGGGMMGSPFTINGRLFDMGRIDIAVPAGAVEIWKFSNATSMAHPIHVHGVRMSVLARDGLQPPPYERGLRDTFVVEPMQTVTVSVETAAVASRSPLMFHCHILEHEDAGMMGQFVTV